MHGEYKPSTTSVIRQKYYWRKSLTQLFLDFIAKKHKLDVSIHQLLHIMVLCYKIFTSSKDLSKTTTRRSKTQQSFVKYIEIILLKTWKWFHLTEMENATYLMKNISLSDTFNKIKDYIKNAQELTRKTFITQDNFFDLIPLVLTTMWYTFNSQI